jgi:hypothetical protein
MTAIIDSLEKGDTLERALEIGRKSMFDYGTLTEAEKAISRHFFIFYNYWRQSVVQFVKNMISDPARMMKYLRAVPALSRMAIGDQNARDLAFYYPPDWGIGRVVLSLSPEPTYSEGSATLTPAIPQADGLNLLSQLFISPLSLLLGPPKAGQDGGRAYDQGLVFQRLGPISKIVGNQIFTGNGFENVPLKKNRIPVEHLALALELPLGERTLSSVFPSYKLISAEQGEKSLSFPGMQPNMVAYIDDADTDKYRKFMASLQTTGLSRPIMDWSRIINSGILNGPYPKSWSSWLAQTGGLITVTGAAMPETVEKRIIEAQTREVEQKVKALKSERLPK